MSVISGQASSTQSGNLTTITNSPNAIIDWNSFSIGFGEITHFSQQDASSSVLNRVTGGNLSELYGTLSSNGRVFLVNPNGITVGPSGRINVAAFFASTHSLSNDSFLNGDVLTFEDQLSGGVIVNLGAISAHDSDVFLIADSISNQGSISAPNGMVGLAAAAHSDVLLADEGDRRVIIRTGQTTQVSEQGVVNQGTIEAAKAELAAAGGNVYALAINNGGAIRANTVEKKGGRILLTSEGGRIAMASGSVIDASGEQGGGEVYVGGSQRGQGPLPNAAELTVDAGAVIRADAGESGDGGTVVLYAEDATTVAGEISATGGLLGGNGGFVEVSGKEQWRYDNWLTGVDVSAPQGAAGTFLIDPNDIDILSGTGAAIAGSPVNSNTLYDADIVSFLNTVGSLIIETTGTGGSGDLTLNSGSSITWNSANGLTLTSTRRFAMDTAVIDSTGSGAITISNTGSTLGNAITLTDSTIRSNEGAISITGNVGASRAGIRTGPTDNSSGVVLDNSTIESVGTGAAAASISITGTGMSITTADFDAGGSNRGVVLQNLAAISSVDGDITITGTGGANGTNFNDGVEIQTGSSISSTGVSADAATISISGTSRNRRGFVTDDFNLGFGSRFFLRDSASGSSNPGIQLQGAIHSVNGDVSLIGQTGTNLRSGRGNDAIQIEGGAINLTGAGNLTLQGASPTAVDFRTIGAATLGGPDALGDISLLGDDIDLDGTSILQARGNLTFSPLTASQSIGLGGGAGAFNLDATELSTLVDGFTSITIGDAVNGTGTANIGTFSIADGLTVFGGTVNPTGPVTERGTATVLVPTTGTAGTVNFAAYSDPTANPSIPNPPGAGGGGGGGGGAGPGNQEVINVLDGVETRLEANAPNLISDTLDPLPQAIRDAINAAASRERLLTQSKESSAEFLEQARGERERELARQEAQLESYKAYLQALADREAAREAARIQAYKDRRAYLRSPEYRALVRAQAQVRRKAEAARRAAEEKARLEAERQAEIAHAKKMEAYRLQALEEWRERRRIEDVVRKQNAKWAAIAAEREAQRQAERLAKIERLKAQRRSWAVSGRVGSGDHNLEYRRYFTPAGKNAFTHYRAALNIDPNSRWAKAGMKRLIDAVVKEIDGSIDRSKRFPYMLKRGQTLLAEAELKFGQLPPALQARKDQIDGITAQWQRNQQRRLREENLAKARAEESRRQRALEEQQRIAESRERQRRFEAQVAAMEQQAQRDREAEAQAKAERERAYQERLALEQAYSERRRTEQQARSRIASAEKNIRDLKRSWQTPFGDPGMRHREFEPYGMNSLRSLSYGPSLTLEQATKLDMDRFPGIADEMFHTGDATHNALKATLKKHYELVNSLAEPSPFGNFDPNAARQRKVGDSHSKISIDEPAALTPFQEAALTSQMEQYGLIPKFKSAKLQALPLSEKLALASVVGDLKAAQQRAAQARREGREVSPIDKQAIQGGVMVLAEVMGGDPTGGMLEGVAVETLSELAVTYDISLEDIATDPLGNVTKLNDSVVREYTAFVTNPVNASKKWTQKAATDILPNTGKALYSAFTGMGSSGGGSSAAAQQAAQRRHVEKLTQFRDNLVQAGKLRAQAKQQAIVRKQMLKQILIERAKLRDAKQQLANVSR